MWVIASAATEECRIDVTRQAEELGSTVFLRCP